MAKAIIGVMGSGKGSNFQALADAIERGELKAMIACVIANVKDAFILERARKLGIPAIYVDPAPFKTKLAGEAELKVIEIMKQHKVEYIALAGFMMIIKQKLLNEYKGRIINIHPSLLPAFPGLEAWKQALHYGVKITGCTVHFVDEGMDTGPIIWQEAVPVMEDDTPETLHMRIQEKEHIAYPKAMQMVLDGKANYQDLISRQKR